jgi:PAS domain S-box-containing protein
VERIVIGSSDETKQGPEEPLERASVVRSRDGRVVSGGSHRDARKNGNPAWGAASLDGLITDLSVGLDLATRAMDACSDGIVIVDYRSDGQPIVYANTAFSVTTGFDADVVVGARFTQIFRKLLDESQLYELQLALSEQRSVHVEFKVELPGARTYWQEARLSPLQEDDQTVTHYMAIINDVTAHKVSETELTRRWLELEEANRQLQALDRIKGSFLNLVSHELRTPLSSVLGYSEFLEDELAGALNAQQHAFVGEIQAGARRLVRLVDDLLDYARLEAGTFRLMPREVDIRDTIAEVVSSLRPLATAKRIELGLFLPNEHCPVYVDPQRINQVVTNLLGNAIKFTQEGGQVNIVHECEGVGVRVSICDNGIGIPQSHLDRLFDKFYQVDPSTTREKGGAGLGLSIAKALVDAHGGEIGVESLPGVGSNFFFTLPINTSKPEPCSEEDWHRDIQ